MKRVLLFLFPLFMTFSCLDTPDPDLEYLSEIYYPELSFRIQDLDEGNMDSNWLYIIDFGNEESYAAGHLPHAINLEMGLLISPEGYLVNQGKAITQRFNKDWPFVVYSSSIDTMAWYIAKTISNLGYPKVYYYSGGVKDWQEIHGDYLHMTYDGMKEWYDEKYPFSDTLQALIDIHPYSWYTGFEVLAGHIPGALSMPADSLLDFSTLPPSLLNEGRALSDTIDDLEATIVIYSAESQKERGEAFARAVCNMNYEKVFLFPGGYESWIDAGNDLEK